MTTDEAGAYYGMYKLARQFKGMLHYVANDTEYCKAIFLQECAEKVVEYTLNYCVRKLQGACFEVKDDIQDLSLDEVKRKIREIGLDTAISDIDDRAPRCVRDAFFRDPSRLFKMLEKNADDVELNERRWSLEWDKRRAEKQNEN